MATWNNKTTTIEKKHEVSSQKRHCQDQLGKYST